MKAIKYYGVFRGSATMPLAAFAVGNEAESYAKRRHKMSVKICYMDCSSLCPACGSLITVTSDQSVGGCVCNGPADKAGYCAKCGNPKLEVEQ